MTIFACKRRCSPIPWQLDERDGAGRLALDQGPRPNLDNPPGVIDSDDEILWMVADGGRQMRPGERPAADCVLEVQVRAGSGESGGRVYAIVSDSPGQRSPRRYVTYDPQRDRLAGARIALGFGGPTPQYLALRGPDGTAGPNLLDRLKVRVGARFLGIVPIGRDEGDLTSERVAWHAGPIRIVRRQELWAHVGFGLRSPTFASEALFYRDFAELPVALRLNFPPTYFFRGVEVRAFLDFRDLRGWRLMADGLPRPTTVGTASREETSRFDALSGGWFALLGPDVTLVQMLDTSPSLVTVERHIFYREGGAAQDPESARGEMPGVGYRLSRWNDVGAGTHSFSSTSFALPAAYDVHEFLREQAVPVEIAVRHLARTVPATD